MNLKPIVPKGRAKTFDISITPERGVLYMRKDLVKSLKLDNKKFLVLTDTEDTEGNYFYLKPSTEDDFRSIKIKGKGTKIERYEISAAGLVRALNLTAAKVYFDYHKKLTINNEPVFQFKKMKELSYERI